MRLSEKDMEDQIFNDPERLIGEPGLVQIQRQINLDGYKADILFEDSNGAHLLVELQKGGLDRTHIWKILDYGFRLKKQNGQKQIRLMVIANKISNKQIETLNHLGVEYRELPDSEFNTGLDLTVNEPNNSNIDPPFSDPASTESYDLVYDRGLDARYFGFKEKRAIAGALYARPQGASQDEVNTFMQELTCQKGFYNMLDQANQWGHEVATWDDPARGRVFKLIYNPSHSAKRATNAPPNWMDLNRCSVPPGATVGRYKRIQR